MTVRRKHRLAVDFTVSQQISTRTAAKALQLLLDERLDMGRAPIFTNGLYGDKISVFEQPQTPEGHVYTSKYKPGDKVVLDDDPDMTGAVTTVAFDHDGPMIEVSVWAQGVRTDYWFREARLSLQEKPK